MAQIRSDLTAKEINVPSANMSDKEYIETLYLDKDFVTEDEIAYFLKVVEKEIVSHFDTVTKFIKLRDGNLELQTDQIETFVKDRFSKDYGSLSLKNVALATCVVALIVISTYEVAFTKEGDWNWQGDPELRAVITQGNFANTVGKLSSSVVLILKTK
jgi:hypothetical protein